MGIKVVEVVIEELGGLGLTTHQKESQSEGLKNEKNY